MEGQNGGNNQPLVENHQGGHHLSRKEKRARRDKIYRHIHHHVDKSIWYKDREVLFRIRVVMFFILAINWASTMFLLSFEKWLRTFGFYTIWNETFVFAYFFMIIFLHPLEKRWSNLIVNFQHQVVTSQSLVVLVFWSILAPYLGLSLGQGSSMVYVNCYKHSVPFLFILHEFLVTYGLYEMKGVYICLAILGVYSVLNVFDSLVLDFTAYPTPNTDPHNWQAYVLSAVLFVLVYFTGRLMIILKRKLVVSHFEKVEPQHAAKILQLPVSPHDDKENYHPDKPIAEYFHGENKTSEHLGTNGSLGQNQNTKQII